MAKKNPVVKGSKSIAVKAGKKEKLAEGKAKREMAPRKPQKPAKKGKKEPLTHKERQDAAWERKTKRNMGERAVAEVAAKAQAGLTYGELENPNLVAKPKPAGPSLVEQALLELVAEQAKQFDESAKLVSLPATPDPQVFVFPDGQGRRWDLSWYETSEESPSLTATRKVVEDEIRQLLKKTRAIFNAYGSGSLPATQLVVGEAFKKEPDGSLSQLRLAEVILADDLVAVEDFLEEVWDRVVELQLIAGSLDSESELEETIRLGIIDEVTVTRLKRAIAEETIRLNLAQRLAELTVSTGAPAEVDETFAALFAETAKAAEAQRHERTALRRTLTERLQHRRKERGGRRSPGTSEESGDEEFIQFLLAHRGDLDAMRDSLPAYLRERVFHLLKDEERKGPLRRQIAAATEAANRLWDELKGCLAAGADNPETAVAQNAAAMKDLLGTLAQIRALNIQLVELEKAPEHRGAEGASWIKQLNFSSKRHSRGPRGMQHLLQRIRQETVDGESPVRSSGRNKRPT